MTTAEIYKGGYFAKKFKLEQNFSVQDKMGLYRYGMSLFPNTYRNFSPGLDPQTKKPITGLDPNSKDILAIRDEKVRTELQNKVIEFKKEIEDYLGDPGILDPRGKYWKEFVFTIQVDKSGKLLLDSANGYNELDPANNPYHKLILCVMLSNDFLPTSRKEAGEPKWVDEKLLLTTEDEVQEDSKESNRREKEKYKYINELFGDNSQYERAFEIAYAMGIQPKPGVSAELLESNIVKAIKDDKLRDAFISKCKLKNEELAVENIFQRGVEYDIVRRNKEFDLWAWGGQNYKDTKEKSVEYLKSPANASKLQDLKEAVDKLKEKKFKSIKQN